MMTARTVVLVLVLGSCIQNCVSITKCLRVFRLFCRQRRVSRVPADRIFVFKLKDQNSLDPFIAESILECGCGELKGITESKDGGFRKFRVPVKAPHPNEFELKMKPKPDTSQQEGQYDSEKKLALKINLDTRQGIADLSGFYEGKYWTLDKTEYEQGQRVRVHLRCPIPKDAKLIFRGLHVGGKVFMLRRGFEVTYSTSENGIEGNETSAALYYNSSRPPGSDGSPDPQRDFYSSLTEDSEKENGPAPPKSDDYTHQTSSLDPTKRSKKQENFSLAWRVDAKGEYLTLEVVIEKGKKLQIPYFVIQEKQLIIQADPNRQKNKVHLKCPIPAEATLIFKSLSVDGRAFLFKIGQVRTSVFQVNSQSLTGQDNTIKALSKLDELRSRTIPVKWRISANREFVELELELEKTENEKHVEIAYGLKQNEEEFLVTVDYENGKVNTFLYFETLAECSEENGGRRLPSGVAGCEGAHNVKNIRMKVAIICVIAFVLVLACAIAVLLRISSKKNDSTSECVVKGASMEDKVKVELAWHVKGNVPVPQPKDSQVRNGKHTAENPSKD